MQSAEAALKSAKAQINVLKAQIEQTRSTLRGDEASLSYTKIYAPMSGTVVSQTTKQGQTLNANQTAPIILRIANLDTMTVWAKVAEADINRLPRCSDEVDNVARNSLIEVDRRDEFADPSKLANIGGTRFAETAESGAATRSGAGTAGLGLIQSGALEDSNVDLSEQLVQLIGGHGRIGRVIRRLGPTEIARPDAPQRRRAGSR